MHEQLELLRPLLADPAPAEFAVGDLMLNPEVFFDPARAAQYRALAAAGNLGIVCIVHDFVVCRRPQGYAQGAVKGCMYYLQAMQDIGRAVFVGERMRADHARIIRREVDCLVVPLGADGLGLKPGKAGRPATATSAWASLS